MSYLKILYSNAIAHLDPTIEMGEVKGIFIPIFGNTNKLIGKTLSADPGIKGGSKYGSQKKIDTVVVRNSCEILNKLPMPFRPYVAMVIACNTIAIESLCHDQLLLGKESINYFYGNSCNSSHLSCIEAEKL